MTDEQTGLAQTVAQLASVPDPTTEMNDAQRGAFELEVQRRLADLNELRDREGREIPLIDDDGKHHTRASVDATHVGLDLLKPGARRSLERGFLKLPSAAQFLSRFTGGDRSEVRRALCDEQLPPLVRQARHLLRHLLAGETVELLDPKAVVLTFQLADGQLREQLAGDETAKYLIGDLLAAVRLRPFPFAACPRCPRIFVRVRRQRYCTRGCARAALEEGRKGQRRLYMRKYMAGRRARKRRAAATRRDR